MTQKSRSRWIRTAVVLALAAAGAAVMALAQSATDRLHAAQERFLALYTAPPEAFRDPAYRAAVARAEDAYAAAWSVAIQSDDSAHYRRDGAAVLNDLRATPGEVDAQLTKETLCARSFHTRDERNVTESQKKRICAAYGQTSGCPGKGYEIDHLISIELGGSNDDRNLWPQPVDAPGTIGFHTKDKLENALHRKVCAGELPLADAQQCIAGDWYACGKRTGVLP
jgi:hypothetical protein